MLGAVVLVGPASPPRPTASGVRAPPEEHGGGAEGERRAEPRTATRKATETGDEDRSGAARLTIDWSLHRTSPAASPRRHRRHRRGAGRRAATRSRTSSPPRATRPETINNLQVPVFIVAGVVGVLVAVAMASSSSRASGAASDDDRRSRCRSTATSSSRSAGRSSRPCSSPASPCSPSLTLLRPRRRRRRRRRARRHRGHRHRPAVVVGVRYDVDGDGERRHRHRQRPRHPRRRAGQRSTITSRDVIHSFWIPALNGKRDAVPGRDHPLDHRGRRARRVRGQCTEFCGLSHAYMRMRVVALSDGRLRRPGSTSSRRTRSRCPTRRARPTRARSCSAPRCSQLPPGRRRRDDGNEDRRRGRRPRRRAHAPNLTHFASRGAFAGGHVRPLDRPGRRRRDRPSTSSRRGCALNVADARGVARATRPAAKPDWTRRGRDRRGMPNLEPRPRSRSMPSSPTSRRWSSRTDGDRRATHRRRWPCPPATRAGARRPLGVFARPAGQDRAGGRGSPPSTTRRSASCTAPPRCSSSSSAASRRC